MGKFRAPAPCKNALLSVEFYQYLKFSFFFSRTPAFYRNFMFRGQIIEIKIFDGCSRCESKNHAYVYQSIIRYEKL